MRNSTQFRSLGLALTLLFSPTAIPQSFDARPILDRAVHPIYGTNEPKPLLQALKSLSGRSTTTYLDFGVELDTDEAHQPMILIGSTEGLTVGQVLNRILAQAAGYYYPVKSPHFISIAPKQLRNDPKDILNRSIATFDVDGIQSGEILTWPERFVPELWRVLHQETPGKQQVYVYQGIGVAIGPLVTLHLRDTTLREILDSVSIATEAAGPHALPLGWVFSMEPTEDAGPAPKWHLMVGAPGNWKQLRTSELQPH
jgi:hypothetical protein